MAAADNPLAPREKILLRGGGLPPTMGADGAPMAQRKRWVCTDNTMPIPANVVNNDEPP